MSQTPIQVKGVGWKASTNFGPALATDGNNFYIAWVDSATGNIFFSDYTGSGWTDPQTVTGTKLDGTVWTAESSATPAWGYDGLNFYLFWKGKTGIDIWFSEFNGLAWSDQAIVQASDASWKAETDVAPAAAFIGWPVTLYWKGHTGNKVWWSSFDDLTPGWLTQSVLSGPTTDVAPGIESLPNSTASIVPIFVKSDSSNDIYVWLYSTKYHVSGSGWAAKTTQAPSATVDADGHDIVFWTGQTGTSIWYSRNTGSALGFGGPPTWSKQATVSGANTNAAPTVADANGPYIGISLLAWKNASDDTVWYLDADELP
jgi:hypothetical protein